MKGAHLSLEDRKTIQLGLEEGLSKAEIARQIGKSSSTMSKEIKNHIKYCTFLYSTFVHSYITLYSVQKKKDGFKQILLLETALIRLFSAYFPYFL